MAAYVRLSQDKATVEKFGVELTPQQYAEQGAWKQSFLRLWVVDPPPVPDPTQLVSNTGVAIGATEAHQTWGLRDRTQAERDADAAAADIDSIKTLLVVLRDGAGTAGERLARLERVVFRLASVLRL